MLACSSLILLKAGFYSWDPNFYETISLQTSRGIPQKIRLCDSWIDASFPSFKAFKQCWNVIFVRNTLGYLITVLLTKPNPSSINLSWAVHIVSKEGQFEAVEGCFVSIWMLKMWMKRLNVQCFIAHPVLVFSRYWEFCFAQEGVSRQLLWNLIRKCISLKRSFIFCVHLQFVSVLFFVLFCLEAEPFIKGRRR